MAVGEIKPADETCWYCLYVHGLGGLIAQKLSHWHPAYPMW